MKEKTRELLTKKEAELVDSGSVINVQFHGPERLQTYIKLTRDLRDKYRDLTQRQKVKGEEAQNVRTAEKAKIFGDVLQRYEKRLQETMAAT